MQQTLVAKRPLLLHDERAEASRHPLPSASVLDTIATLTDIALPTLAKGIVIRRPRAMAVAERLNLDRRAVRRMERLSAIYGLGPLPLRIPGRSIALVLNPRDVMRILNETPAPFATSTPEKRSVLAHFEPKNVLLSDGAERAERRHYNVEALETSSPIHSLATTFVDIVNFEIRELREKVFQKHELDWTDFSAAWFRIVRRVVFGNSAREDHELSRTMEKLRYAANWGFLRPQRAGLRGHLFARIRTYLDRAEPGSLAGLMSQIHTSLVTAPEQQVPQWLFAFDPAGMATFRTLALLTAHAAYAQQARGELADPGRLATTPARHTRAAVLESLRLWPTSPMILREARETTEWTEGVLPAHTTLVIFSPYFHRNRQLPYADTFTPELWLHDPPATQWPLIPFSDGPAACPGRNLVLLLSTATIAAILGFARIRLKRPHPVLAHQPLPGTLNHFNLRFELAV
jgi:cytochrome P450